MKKMLQKSLTILSLILISALLIITLCLTSINHINLAEEEYSIKFYNESSIVSMISDNTQEYDALYLNNNNFVLLDNAYLNSFLYSGGIVIVENHVSGDVLNTKLTEDVITYEETDNDYYYGFSLYLSEGKVISDHIFLLPIVNATEEEIMTIDEKDFAQSIVKSTKKKIIPVSTYNNKSNFVYGSESFYFAKPNGTRLGSLTITSYIYEVAKAVDSNGTKRGVYDVRTKYVIDAENDFYIKDYDVVLGSSQNVIDASFLQSEVSTTVSLGGSLGFSGDVVEGSLNAGVSYTYTGTSQKITNDLPAGNVKTWRVDDLKKNYGASFALEPCIRIVNSNDNNMNHIFARLDDFLIKEYSWFINPSFRLNQNSRMNMNLKWDKNGNASCYVSKL